MVATTHSSNQPPRPSGSDAEEPDDPAEAVDSREDDYDSRPKKKQKNHDTGHKLRRIKGKLAGLMNMPTDMCLFTKIMSHLQPFDLLCLARASKLFRSILMLKSSRSMWAESRKNVPSFNGFEFPDCPPDLSEPEYASLAFDKGCMNCDSVRASRVDYTYRLRACKPCSLLSCHNNNRDAFNFCQLCNISGGVTDEVDAMFKLVPRQYGGGRFFSPIALRVYEQCMVRKAQLTAEEYKKYLLERESAMPAVSLNCRNLRNWYEAYMQDQRRQNVNTKEGRCEDVTKRLLEDGWDVKDFPQTSVYYPDSFWDSIQNFKKWTKLVYQAKPLTAKTWSNIKPQLEAIITYNRAQRHEKEERNRLLDLRRQRKGEIASLYEAFVEEESTPETIGLYPTPRELTARPCIDTLLGRVDIETPLRPEAWLSVLDEIREDIRTCQAAFRSKFASVLRQRLRAHAISQERAFGHSITAEDDVNMAFLSKDPSRVTFTWKRGGYDSVTKPFPAVLAKEREWRINELGYFSWESAALSAFLNTNCVIEDYDKFELVDGIWT